MSVRNLAAAGLVAYVLGGPLLLLDLPGESLGMLGRVGAIGVWLGVGLLLTALLGISRTQHRMLRTQAEWLRGAGTSGSRVAQRSDAAAGPDAAGSDAAVSEATGPELPAALREELTRLERHIDERLDVHQRGLLQVVDARILGIHETVRDLSPSDVDGPA